VAIKRFPSASQGGIALRAVAWESLSISRDASLTLQYARLVPKDFPPQTDARVLPETCIGKSIREIGTTI
jgi:hypothetical protein